MKGCISEGEDFVLHRLTQTSYKQIGQAAADFQDTKQVIFRVTMQKCQVPALVATVNA